MTKANIIEAVIAKTGLKKKDAEAAVTVALDSIIESLAKGEKVAIASFGSYEVKVRAARTGRNPQTGEAIEIPASKYVSFSAAKAMKDSIN